MRHRTRVFWRSLRQPKNLWILFGTVLFGLLEDRAQGWANDRIDDWSPKVFRVMARHALDFLFPLGLLAVVASVLAILSWRETRPTREPIAVSAGRPNQGLDDPTDQRTDVDDVTPPLPPGSPLVTEETGDLVRQLRVALDRGRVIREGLHAEKESERRMKGLDPLAHEVDPWEERTAELLDALPLHQEHFLLRPQLRDTLDNVNLAFGDSYAPLRRKMERRMRLLGQVIDALTSKGQP